MHRSEITIDLGAVRRNVYTLLSALQGAQHAVGITRGMAALQLFEQRRRSQARHGGEHRHQLRAPDLGEGILARAIAPCPIPLAGQYRSTVDPAPRALAKPGARRRSRLGMSIFA